MSACLLVVCLLSTALLLIEACSLGIRTAAALGALGASYTGKTN